MNKAKQESQKAEIEYNCRAAEYNVEILKNQLENITTEMQLVKAQNEKVNKSFNILKQSYQRMKGDIEYYKKGKNPPRRQKSQNATPQNGGSVFKNFGDHCNLSNASSFLVPESEIIGGNQSLRLSIEPSAFGVGPPLPAVETEELEVQADIWTVADIAAKEERIKLLSEQLEARN